MMRSLKVRHSNISRIVVVVDAAESEISAYEELYPYATTIVAEPSKSFTKVLPVEVYPTFFLLNSRGNTLWKKEDVTHSLAAIDSAISAFDSKVAAPSLRATPITVGRARTSVHILPVREQTPLLQAGSACLVSTHNGTIYIHDAVRNSILQMQLGDRIIKPFYKVGNDIDYYYKTAENTPYVWPNGKTDSIDYWREFQETQPLTLIQGVVVDSDSLAAICRLHTGYERLYLNGRRRVNWRVGMGLVRFGSAATVEKSTLMDRPGYGTLPPFCVLSNHRKLFSVSWFSYYELSDGDSLAIHDSLALIGFYDHKSGGTVISHASRAIFNADLDKSNMEFVPDSSEGFYILNRLNNQIIRAIPNSETDYSYTSFPPSGVWERRKEMVKSVSGHFFHGILHCLVSLAGRELWLQQYTPDGKLLSEQVVYRSTENDLDHCVVVTNTKDSLMTMIKTKKKRWALLQIQGER
jgi:hypothetical protein